MVAGPAQVLSGEVVGIGVNVANVGTRVADAVTVTVTIPPSVQPPAANNTGQSGVSLIAAGTIRGTAGSTTTATGSASRASPRPEPGVRGDRRQ